MWLPLPPRPFAGYSGKSLVGQVQVHAALIFNGVMRLFIAKSACLNLANYKVHIFLIEYSRQGILDGVSLLEILKYRLLRICVQYYPISAFRCDNQIFASVSDCFGYLGKFISFVDVYL